MRKFKGGYYEIKPDENGNPVYVRYNENRFLIFIKNFFKMIFKVIKSILYFLMILGIILCVNYIYANWGNVF